MTMEYKCAHCGGAFNSDAPDDVARAELKENFPSASGNDYATAAVVCDDCFKMMTAALPLEQFNAERIQGNASLTIGGVTYPLKGDFDFEPQQPEPMRAPLTVSMTIPIIATGALPPRYMRKMMKALTADRRRVKREQRKFEKRILRRARELLKNDTWHAENIRTAFITAGREAMADMPRGFTVELVDDFRGQP